MVTVEGTFFLVGSMVARDVGDGQTARILLILEWESAPGIRGAEPCGCGCRTIAGMRYRVLPRGFIVFSGVMTGALAIATLPVGPAGLFGAGSGALWLVVVSLVLALGLTTAKLAVNAEARSERSGGS
jgi:hypothetical protein